MLQQMLNWFGLSGKATENICADFSKMLSGDTIVTSLQAPHSFPGQSPIVGRFILEKWGVGKSAIGFCD